jgi:hypothetical protein
MDYKEGKIYAIRSPHTTKIYIGSTCQPLSKRLYQHRRSYAWYLKGNGANVRSYKILEKGDEYIELLEKYSCETKEELRKREGELIRQHHETCINKQIAGRSYKMYKSDNKDALAVKNKEYRQENSSILKEKKKIYREKNKEHIKKMSETMIHCLCGSIHRYSDGARHRRSKVHQQHQLLEDWAKVNDILLYKTIHSHQQVKNKIFQKMTFKK